MRSFVALLACSAIGQDPTPLAEHERYLEPYLDNLISYRDNPIARRYIMLTNLVDVLPTWLVDLFVPLLIKDSTLELPFKFNLPLPDPTHIFPGIPPAVTHLEIESASINNLNEFEKFKPLKFQEGTRFTWAGQMEWKEAKTTTLKLKAKLVVFNLLKVGVDFTITVTEPAIDFEAIVAFDRSKMCEVWGHILESSPHCAAWPLFVDQHAGSSGLAFNQLALHASDMSLDDLQFEGIPFDLGPKVADWLKGVFEEKKPELLQQMPDISEEVRRTGNNLILGELPALHEYYPCSIDEIEPKHVDVSTVCFTNNAAFAMHWGYANCPTHQVSQDSSIFAIGQHRCMNVLDIWPDAEQGQVLRAQVEAIAGIHEIIDPPVRYVPNSNVAAYQCDGTTLQYKCHLISVEPEDPAQPVTASRVCLLNHGPYVMHFSGKDERTGQQVEQSNDFPVEQTRCVDLAPVNGVQGGDEFSFTAHADGGRNAPTDHNVVFQPDGPQVTFVCTGTTLSINCRLLTAHLQERGNNTITV